MTENNIKTILVITVYFLTLLAIFMHGYIIHNVLGNPNTINIYIIFTSSVIVVLWALYGIIKFTFGGEQ